MRQITKGDAPQILKDNEKLWLADYVADPGSESKRYKYRNAEIKSALLEECHSKCVYCESKIGHNTPGDVEHKTPTSSDISLHFNWDNLTIACTECNRRKSTLGGPKKPFLDPYEDGVEGRVFHYGPTVSWAIGDVCAEVTISKLELHDMSRLALIRRKVELIGHLNAVVGRLGECDQVLVDLMRLKIDKMKSVESEYSAMISAICLVHGI